MSRSLFLLTLLLITAQCKSTEPVQEEQAFVPFIADVDEAEEEEEIELTTDMDIVLDMDEEPQLPWINTYEGTLPCADCEGIYIWLGLYNDGSFFQKMNYIGNSEDVTERYGSYKVDLKNRVVLKDKEGKELEWYLFEDGDLFKLDENKEKITGDLAGQYILKALR